MSSPQDLSAILRSRRPKERRIDRYRHTRSFKNLSGSDVLEAESRRHAAAMSQREARIIFLVFFLLFAGFGIWGLLF